METKSTSGIDQHTWESAFRNVHGGLSVALVWAGVVLVLLSLNTLSVQAQQKNSRTSHPSTCWSPALFDCSKVHELGIAKQTNLRAGAIMIFCGEAQGGSASSSGNPSHLVEKLSRPVEYGITDINLITGTETFPHIDQSTTFTAGNPDNPLQMWLPTTTREAPTQIRAAVPAHQSPPMAVTRSAD